MEFGTPYLRTKNALCERQNCSFKTVMRILMAQEKGRNWLRVLPYAIYLINNQVSTRTGYSPHELFFVRLGFHMEFPTPQDANPKVKEWMEKQAALASKAKELLQKIRERENTCSNRGRKAVEYQIGDMVLVHHKRLPRWKKNNLDLPYYGPLMVTDVGPSSVKIRASPRFGGKVEVGFPFLKGYTLMEEYDLDLGGFDNKMAAEEDELNDDQDEDMTSELMSTEDSEGEGQLPDLNRKEMKAKGIYKVEAILRSKYRHGWRFLVKWEGYSMAEAKWEPYTAFILDQGNVSSVFSEYCIANGLPKVLKLAEFRSRKKHDKHSK